MGNQQLSYPHSGKKFNDYSLIGSRDKHLKILDIFKQGDEDIVSSHMKV